MFCEKSVLKNFTNSQKNTCARVSFLIKLQASGNFIKKETLVQVSSYEFCKIFKNTFLQNTSSGCFSNIFSFYLSSVIFQVSVADSEHVFLSWERYRITIVVLQILEIPYPTSKCSKQILKQDVKSVKS